MDDRLRQVIADSGDLADLRAAAAAGGMKTLLQSGLEKASQGITSIAEVIRVAPLSGCLQ